MPTEARVREAELAFLNAPFVDKGWLLAVQQLAHVTGSAMAQLCGGGNGASPLAFNVFSDQRHDPHGHLSNPALYGPENWRIGTTRAARTIQFEADYAAYRAHNPTGYYDDAISDLDMPFGCQSALILDRNGMFGLALLRSGRDGPCTPETLAQFASIARQAHRAVRVQMALGEEAAELLIEGVADRTEMTILLDRHASVLAMTELAESLFDHPQGLRLDGLRLGLADPAEDRFLLAACHRLLSSDAVSGPLLHETVIGRSADRPNGRWRAVVVRVGGPVSALGVEPQLAVTLTPLR